MRLSTLFALVLTFVISGCGDRSPEDSCAVICQKNALCQPGASESLCKSTCVELAAEDSAYAASISTQADCYEEQASYYEEEKGVCVAIEGGACQATPQ
ncbi:hypothetical protein [Polyangium sp. y55x31]|uniref:hypothetical protein n=1 Tax=Polyangium sp. y55x31 TaxID=3042688 RepID=UPI002482A83D|nr:hypothetical protein [Polyangium sp. y55x31]MDI1475846.1 hypothetical protein [Polyangium sp. y55x31]